MYFSLFLDESGKVHKGDYTALCGYVSTMDQWGLFQQRWDQLRFKHGIPPIHLSRIVNPSSRDDGWKKKHQEITAGGVVWEDWYQRMLGDFAELISSSDVVCVGAVVDAVAYRELKEAAPEDFLLANADSNVFLLQNVVTSALDKIDVVDPVGLMTICIDDDRENAFEYYRSYWNIKTMLENPNLPAELRPRFERFKTRVDQISFSGDNFHPALQAADMIAYVSRAWKVDEGKSLNDPLRQELFTHLFAHLTFGGTQQPKIVSRANLEKLAGNTAKSVRKAKDEAECWGI